MANFVSAPLVIAKNEDGSDLYLYQGAQVPSHVKGDALKALVDSGMVATSEEEAAEQAAENEGPGVLDKPAGNASESDWRAYAVSKGMTQEEADSKSRNELREQFA